MELCAGQACIDNVRPCEVRPVEYRPAEVQAFECFTRHFDPTQVGLDLWILFSPFIPGADALFENFEMLFVSHTKPVIGS